MEHTTHQHRTQSQNTADSSAGQRFHDGMHAYAIGQPGQLRTLCSLSAAVLLGILLGIFSFFFYEAAPIANLETAASDYIAARAFSSFDSLRAYLDFFSAWFFHHAALTAPVLITLITVYPTVICKIILVLRGFLCGFAVCTLSGTFSLFAVYLTFAQTALCALSVYLGTKCIRYASRRAKLPAQSKSHHTMHWLLTETAPTAAASLITLTALASGLLLISCICTMLAE